MTADLIFRSAVDLARLIRTRAVSAREVMTAHLAQIERINPRVNAFCTLVCEQALRDAEQTDRGLNSGNAAGPLCRLPVAIKDTVLTKDIRTTYGSRICKDFVPHLDALHVQRLKAAGAIVVGKTNVPEFGAGSQTFNDLFGDSRNPYDLSKTCGGSSGGAVIALACGMVPLADGSDLGGSLRNPASFCNVVGFRPSPGRVPGWPARLAWESLGVLGPLTRTVEDAALLLSVLAGPDPRAPLSIAEPGAVFTAPLQRDFTGARVAWSRDLGRYPVQPAVTAVCDGARATFASLGCIVEDAHPDLHDADEIFQVLRAWIFASELGDALHAYRDLMKDTVVWNIERGLELDGRAVSRAEVARSALYQRTHEFFEDYDFLVLPVSQVAPFPVEQRWITEINGVRMQTYIDWMATCYAITLTALPAISVPCGFTPNGLPVGLQIVGRYQRDVEVLQLAHAFEQATRVGRRRPALALAV
jgi:amidase